MPLEEDFDAPRVFLATKIAKSSRKSPNIFSSEEDSLASRKEVTRSWAVMTFLALNK